MTALISCCTCFADDELYVPTTRTFVPAETSTKPAPWLGTGHTYFSCPAHHPAELHTLAPTRRLAK